MNIIWDSEDNTWIESWGFEEWFINPKFAPSKETLEKLKLFYV